MDNQFNYDYKVEEECDDDLSEIMRDFFIAREKEIMMIMKEFSFQLSFLEKTVEEVSLSLQSMLPPVQSD